MDNTIVNNISLIISIISSVGLLFSELLAWSKHEANSITQLFAILTKFNKSLRNPSPPVSINDNTTTTESPTTDSKSTTDSSTEVNPVNDWSE